MELAGITIESLDGPEDGPRKWQQGLDREIQKRRQRKASTIKEWTRAGFAKLGYGIYRLPRSEGGSRLVDPLFVAEGHHRHYGLPWCLGRDQLEMLLARGLEPGHRFLDFGCGSLRAGVWIIGYLDPGYYYGIDAHYRSLEAGANYEIPLHGLEEKRPRLLHSTGMEVGRFGVLFDRVLAFSVFNHLTPAQSELALKRISSTLAPGARLLVSHRLPCPPESLSNRFDLELVHHELRQCRMLDERIEWFELATRRF